MCSSTRGILAAPGVRIYPAPRTSLRSSAFSGAARESRASAPDASSPDAHVIVLGKPITLSEELMKALIVGGTGPSGPFLANGLIERGYKVTIFHRGTHEIPEIVPEVAH